MLRRQLGRVAIIVCLGIATLAYGSLEKRVTMHIEGKPVAVRTFAGTVSGALERVGVDVSPRDQITPSPATAIKDGSVIRVRRAKEITLVLDGRPRNVVVTGLTIEDALREIELAGTLVDRVDPPRETQVRAGMTITYERAVPLTIHHDGKKMKVVTNATSVRDVIEELGIRLRKRDELRPAGRVEPRPNMDVEVLRVGFKTETERITLDYDTILRRDPDLEYGARRVLQEGRTGLETVRYRVKYVNGEVVSRKALGSTVVRAPADRIIAVGAGFPGCACNDGSDSGEASWYRQADGMTAAHRTLPFGTVVRVENLENGKWVNVTIRDRGPFVDGRVIDLSDESFRRLAPLSSGVIRVRIHW